MRKYIITGSHSVGKTSLCTKIYEKLRSDTDIEVLPEIARILLAKGIPMNDKANEYSIVSYLLEYLRLWRNKKNSIILSDRGVLDLYAYISVKRPDDVRNEFVELIYEMVLNESETIDAYVYLPIEFKMQRDTIRPDDEIYQFQIDTKIRELLNQVNTKVIEVNGSLGMRVARMVEIING